MKQGRGKEATDALHSVLVAQLGDRDDRKLSNDVVAFLCGRRGQANGRGGRR